MTALITDAYTTPGSIQSDKYGGDMNDLEYWSECISDGAGDCDLVLTKEQVKSLAESVMGGA